MQLSGNAIWLCFAELVVFVSCWNRDSSVYYWKESSIEFVWLIHPKKINKCSAAVIFVMLAA